MGTAMWDTTAQAGEKIRWTLAATMARATNKIEVGVILTTMRWQWAHLMKLWLYNKSSAFGVWRRCAAEAPAAALVKSGRRRRGTMLNDMLTTGAKSDI